MILKNTTPRIPLLYLMLLALIWSCATKTNNPQEDSLDDQLTDDYSALIDSLIETKEPRIFNGIIQIKKGGETRYLKEHGYSDIDQKIPISVDDKFRIMSNSKQVTAVLILREAEKETIDLDLPISEYLTNLKATWADSVTVHQLLNMSSGISNLEKPLLFKPGQGYHYSNPGYGLLGRIIEKVSGKSYADNANDLFEEFGMNNTFCYEINGENKGLINGYALLETQTSAVDFQRFGFDEDGWNDFLPAGGIISDAHDLFRWDIALHNGEILKSEYYQKMVTPSNSGPHAVFDNDTIGYGYGLRINDRYPIKYIGHGGRGFGFVSLKIYIPENDVNVIVWENIYYMDDFPNGADIIYHFENEIRNIVLKSNLVQ